MTRITRRLFLEGLGLGILTTWRGATASTLGPIDQSGSSAADPQVVEKWMNTWIEASRYRVGTRNPVGTLHVSRFVEPIYYLLKPITWKPNPGQEHLGEVTVPTGFVTDFASIPRAFFSLLRPDGEYTYPAIVHDYLYWTQSRPRGLCDNILKFGMIDFHIKPATVNTIYNAVRVGGEASWRKNTKLRMAGEKRVLKKFPDDPRTRWAAWKKRSDVFE